MVMLALSARMGGLAQRIGPRRPMTIGPLLIATGVLLLSRVGQGSTYVVDVLPALLVFALGLATTVAPLTSTVLSAVESRHAGVASAVNNAVARAAGLFAVALLPLLAGLGGDAMRDAAAFTAGFRTAMQLAAVLAALGGVLAWLLISDEYKISDDRCDSHCAISGPPLRRA
jgi:Na+/melibiose symporter-like transporter